MRRPLLSCVVKAGVYTKKIAQLLLILYHHFFHYGRLVRLNFYKANTICFNLNLRKPIHTVIHQQLLRCKSLPTFIWGRCKKNIIIGFQEEFEKYIEDWSIPPIARTITKAEMLFFEIQSNEPYSNENSMSNVQNLGKNSFVARVQEDGQIVERMTIQPSETKQVSLMKGHALYLDSESTGRACITFKKQNPEFM